SQILRTASSTVTSNVASGTNPDDIRSATFASAVLRLKDKLYLGLSRQEVLHSTNSTLGSFNFQFAGSPGEFSVEGTGSLDVQQTSYNVSAGYRVPGTGDRLALGGSVSYCYLRVRSEVANSILDPNGDVAGREILVPTLDLRTRIRDSDSALGFGVGA